MFITKDNPISIPSTKSVIEKPAYSKCKKRPIRIPIARDIIPMDNILSSLSLISFTSLFIHYFYFFAPFFPWSLVLRSSISQSSVKLSITLLISLSSRALSKVIATSLIFLD
jgi:hypothetical protein